MSAGRTILRTVLVAAVVVIADQATKAIVRSSLDPFKDVKVIPGVHLVRSENSGVAFSVFSGGGPLVVIVAILALGALLAFFVTHLHRRLVWLPTGLLLGGAAGNLIDRVRARRGDGLRQAAALAGVQPRRRLHHASASLLLVLVLERVK